MNPPPDRSPFSSEYSLPRDRDQVQGQHFGWQLRPFRVVLLNNEGQDLMFVVRTIMELTRLCRAEATHKMWEAHHCGRSQLLVTHKERAELYADQFGDRGLRVTVEPA